MVLSCCIVKGIAPKGDIQICFGHSKSDVINVVCIFDVASPVSYGKKDRFPARSLFYTWHFPATHMHMEHCDWLKSMKATSIGQFDYLSLGISPGYVA